MTEPTPKIPEQLRDWRFIRLKPRTKEPLENDWATTANYDYDDPRLQEHLANGGNYGVLGGVYKNADHVILDCDDPYLEKLVREKLPNTFTVRTPSGGAHFYFLVKK